MISRWMPDLDFRSKASFISSKEGETPVASIRSLIKSRSCFCLGVSIKAPNRVRAAAMYKPRTSISVPFAFRKEKHIFSRRKAKLKWDNGNEVVSRQSRRIGWPDDQTIGLCEGPDEGTVLIGKCCDRLSSNRCAHIVFAAAIGF